MSTPAAALAIDARALTYRYGDRLAVDALDMSVESGAVVALLGPNGAGKSTTIAMLLGLTAPQSGHLTVDGRAPREAVRAGRVAGMLQDSGFMPGVRVRELVELSAACYPEPIDADEAIAVAGLDGLAHRRVDRLSGGQAQRLRFAVAFVADPRIIVLDEPTRALDVAGRIEFWAAMRSFAARGRTVLFATHYLDEVEQNAQRVLVIARGAVVAEDTPDGLRAAAGASRVSFALDTRPGERERRVLADLRGVMRVDAEAGRLILVTSRPDETVRSLVASELSWTNLAVAPPTLEDAFLRLTGDGALGQRTPEGVLS
jgi:ABC-2 type transport system ATP-binding protein